jgi:hypothetical protein
LRFRSDGCRIGGGAYGRRQPPVPNVGHLSPDVISRD